MKKLLICLIACLCLCGCGNKEENKNNDQQTIDKNVTAVEAREMINEGAVLIDVRMNYEYMERHIEGAKLLPLDDINEESIGKIVDSKDTVIIVYCQSGNRSSMAIDKLAELGYTNVYDLGAIDNWEE